MYRFFYFSLHLNPSSFLFYFYTIHFILYEYRSISHKSTLPEWSGYPSLLAALTKSLHPPGNTPQPSLPRHPPDHQHTGILLQYFFHLPQNRNTQCHMPSVLSIEQILYPEERQFYFYICPSPLHLNGQDAHLSYRHSLFSK